MSTFEIPLRNQAQRLTVTLSGVQVVLVVRWCPPLGAWVIDMYDSVDEPLLLGVPMITGADLLAQYEYLGIPGQLFVQSDDDVDAVPTFDSLGGLGHLYYVTP